MKGNNFFKNNWFLLTMVLGMVAGAITGAVWPGATCLEPLGTIFINMMFCVVVPMVFFSISSAVANMVSAKKAGKVMGVTIVTFFCTAAVAAIIMYIIVRLIPIVPQGFEAVETAEATEIDVPTLIINFFTKPDFIELFSRRAILPLIVAAILFGFGVQLNGGRETLTAKILADVNACLMKTMRIITYYAPIGFFGFFAYLVATYGPSLIGAYGKTIIIYYVVAFAYMFIFAPIYARFGGGKGAEKVMFSHLFAPAAVAFGTCSSVATIPTNMEACEDTGISKDVSEIVIPMGATMHMDGSAMSAIIKVAFLFGIFGQDYLRTGLLYRPGDPGDHCGGVLFRGHVRHSRRRRHGRDGAVLHLLPRADRHCASHRVGPGRPGRSSRHDGERGDGLCLDLYRVEVCGRQGLAAEAAA